MIIGHRKILKDLQVLAGSGNLSQSYLFFGPSMVGKRTAAMAFAKFLEKRELAVPHKGEVLQDAKVIDLTYMKELNAKTKDSIGIDVAREIRNYLNDRPAASLRRTLIIDDAEMLTTEAQNALLKVTEEPPANSLIIFIASDPDAIVPTILSRVQKIYFGPIAETDIVKWLETELSNSRELESLKNDEMAVRKEDRKGDILKVKAAEAAKRSFGKPGLAWRLLFDEDLKERLVLAEKFLKMPVATRRDFIKELIEPDDFSLRRFLEAVTLQLAWFTLSDRQGVEGQKNKIKFGPLWHKTLTLHDAAMNFGLNPRLQLENLLI